MCEPLLGPGAAAAMTMLERTTDKGIFMADANTTDSQSPVDYGKHKRDYALLISMLKWGGLISILLAFLVMIILAN